MPGMVLVDWEKKCRHCDKETMEPSDRIEPFKLSDAVVLKILLKCNTCGRTSFVIRDKG